MKLYSENKEYKLYQGNMLDMLEVIEPNSIDSVVTDPPYELNFMGKGWDNSGIAFQPSTWIKCLQVLKPGGYLLAFGGSRTYHRIAVAIEDAGFEIRDTIMWLYGSGFPKSMDISKQIDKRGGESTSWFGEYLKNTLKEKNMTYSDLAKHFLSKTGGITGCVHNWVEGKNMPTIEQFNKICEILDLPFKKMEEAEREVIGKSNYSIPSKIYDIANGSGERLEQNITIPSTDLAKKWQGWGTALKPSFEPIIVARKPFAGSLVDNVIKYGVGGINIDECRVGEDVIKGGTMPDFRDVGKKQKEISGIDKLTFGQVENAARKPLEDHIGRFPANTILTYDDTDFDEVCGGFPDTKSGKTNSPLLDIRGNNYNNAHKNLDISYERGYDDEGSASRYFYCAKASKKDRDEGLTDFQEVVDCDRDVNAYSADTAFNRSANARKNIHPTVKPTELMQYLIRLVTPNGGIVLDPFNGSGSTGKATMYENREGAKNYKYIGIELTDEYLPISKARIEYAANPENKIVWEEVDEDTNEVKRVSYKEVSLF